MEVDEDRIVVTPFGATEEGEEPQPLRVLDPAGEPVDPRIVIDR